MPELVEDLRQLPRGAHAVSFHASREEGADHAVAFLAGTPEDQTAAYFVPDAALAGYYDERLAQEAPGQVGCVHVLPHEQVDWQDGRLRPVAEVRELLTEHPEGITAAGETLSYYWEPENIPEHLEYEAWFEAQPREGSRFLCPYDLRAVPPEDAPEVMRELGSHHSHVMLSHADDPAVRLLQLFVFRCASEIPARLRAGLDWALSERLIEAGSPFDDLVLTEAGERIVRNWSAVAIAG